VATTQISAGETHQLVRRLQAVTIAWMVIEVSLSLWSAWKASSPALAAFAGDSAVELLSAAVVMRRFRNGASQQEERFAARVAGSLLIVLALFVVATSVISLLGYHEPQPSYLGMAVLLAALVIMPWVASQKRKLSAITQSAALRADAAQSSLCAYLSLIALVGLAVHSVWNVEWADPVAALALTPLILFEAREAFRGNPCNCS